MKQFFMPLFTKRNLLYALLVLWDRAKSIWRFLFSKNKSSPYTGRYMTPLERLEVFSKDYDGVVINGRLALSASRSCDHVCVLGATGSGKSSTIFIPTIYSLEYPMIILDCSGALFEQTSGHLKSKGFRIHRLNFSDPFLGSDCYNPMLRANTDSKLKRLAATLVETSLGEGKDPFWNNSARNLLYVLMRIIKESTDAKYHTLPNVRCLLNNLTSNPNSPGCQWIMKHASEASFMEFKGAMSASPKVIDSILATCRTALEVLSDPVVSKMISTDTLGDLQKIRRRKTALYISIKETDISYLNFIVSVILGDILDMAMNTPTERDQDLFLLLDEFAHFKIKDFLTILATIRKRRVSVTLAAQSRLLLAYKYGEKAANAIISGGCNSHLILPGQVHFQENAGLSKLLGDQMVYHNGKQVVRPLITPDEIYALKGKALFLHSGYRPALLKLRPFYKNKRLLSYSKKRPVSFKRKRLPEPVLLSFEEPQLPQAGRDSDNSPPLMV